MGSFSYTSRAGFIFMRGVSLTYPVLASFLFYFLSGEFLLHIPCWVNFSVGSFSYTSHACLIFLWGVSLTYPMLAFFFFFFIYGVFLTHPMLASYLWGEFLLHIPQWLYFYLRNFSYTSHVGFLSLSLSLSLFNVGVSLTHPVRVSFLSGEFFLPVPCWFHFYAGSFSYASCAVCCVFVVVFIWGVSLTHAMLASFLSVDFKKIKNYTSRAGFFFQSGEFLLYIPCCLCFYVGSFSYTSRAAFIFMRGSFSYALRAGFIFIQGVSLTHLLLASLCGEFFLHILCWLHWWGVSLTCTVLASSCGEFLLHIPCWPLYVGYFSFISMLASLCW